MGKILLQWVAGPFDDFQEPQAAAALEKLLEQLQNAGLSALWAQIDSALSKKVASEA